MDNLWLTNPSLAYTDWQAREAAGANRKPFAVRSIVQHRAMFDRFYRHLHASGDTLASFGADRIDAFFLTAEGRSYSLATKMRYLKLLDRLCRHLVFAGVRNENPAADLERLGGWPQGDPAPVYLPPDADARLQQYVQPLATDSRMCTRSRAIVAIYLGTGISAVEGRHARMEDLQLSCNPPYLHVRAHGARKARTVHLPKFAIAPLQAWMRQRPSLPIAGDLIFSLRSKGQPPTDMSLGTIVRAALEEIGFAGEDMSPRVLRNTYCRRLLLSGVDRAHVSERMGLASYRTVDRLAATILL